MIITINDIDYEVVNEFPVLWLGWELDSVGYVGLSPEKKHVLILSDHGVHHVVTKEKLEERIKFYEDVIFKSKLALGTIDG